MICTPNLHDELPEYEDPDGDLENEDDIDLGEETIDETE
jgi:hypothetical protein